MPTKMAIKTITRARLFDLQRYSASHMNADSGVIYLEEQYKRDVKNAIAAASSNNPSGKYQCPCRSSLQAAIWRLFSGLCAVFCQRTS